MTRTGFKEVKEKLEKFKTNGGLAGYKLDDIVLPHKDVDGLAADFGDYIIDDSWKKKMNTSNGKEFPVANKATPVKTAQIRKIFSEIKSLHIKYEESKGSDINELLNDIDRELLLLIPKITFAKARKNLLGSKDKNLGDIFILAIEACRKGLNDTNRNRHENFERLYQFIESLVAYHKQYSEDK